MWKSNLLPPVMWTQQHLIFFRPKIYPLIWQIYRYSLWLFAPVCAIFIFLPKHTMSPIRTVVKKEGMRDVEAIKCLPWFGQHHWRQTKGELWMELSFPGGSDGKESACRAGDPGLIPGLGRSPGGGNGNPFQYSWLGNPMDRGAWWATVHGVTKSWTWISD